MINDGQMLRIAFLGPEGTYSQEAACKYMQGKNFRLVGATSLEEICTGILDGRWEQGLLPVENSTEGTVGQSMDILATADHKLKISGEVLLPIKHSLLAPPGVTLDDIELVISHPQALGQCGNYIQRTFPGVDTMDMASTAHAAREVARKNLPWAAIASPVAASYGLKILARDINDYQENITRFLVLGREDARPNNCSKTTIIVNISDCPGALHSILGEFAARGINLTRIESRPSKRRLGEYIFFIDFAGHAGNPVISEIIANIREKCTACRVVGSYPSTSVTVSYKKDVPKSLNDLRRKINEIDNHILSLLSRRMTLSDEAVQYKEKDEIRDEGREKEILNRLAGEAAKKGISPLIVTNLFKVILDYSVWRQINIFSKQLGGALCRRE